VGKDRLGPPEQLVAGLRERTLFAGEIDAGLRQAIIQVPGGEAVLAPPAIQLRRAGFLAELAWQRLQRGERDDPAALAPLYLHSQPEAEAPAVTRQECG